MNTLSYGLELEIPTAAKSTGLAWNAARYAPEMAELWRTQGHEVHEIELHGQPVDASYKLPLGTLSQAPLISAGFDSTYNNVELAIGPFSELGPLNEVVCQNLAQLQSVVSKHDALLLNFSEHPACPCTPAQYAQLQVPRFLYDELNYVRNWKHYIGVDAKAQLSPCTGIAPQNAVAALNLTLALSPIFIALYANSPFENGSDTGQLENRLSLWTRMLDQATFPADLALCKPPQNFFTSLHHYFSWFLDGQAPLYVIPTSHNANYKKFANHCVLPLAPSVLNFMRQPTWNCIISPSAQTAGLPAQTITVLPTVDIFQQHQFGQYTDARIRFAFREMPALPDFLAAWEAGPATFDPFFIDHVDYTYIEVRMPGSNLPDASLPTDIARSLLISASALHKGLLNSFPPAPNYLESFQLRAEAIQQGPASLAVRSLISTCLDHAAAALPPHEQWMLDYPRQVLETQQNGAMLARALWHEFDMNSPATLRAHLPAYLSQRALRL